MVVVIGCSSQSNNQRTAAAALVKQIETQVRRLEKKGEPVSEDLAKALVVAQAETLSMSWCLTCHRDPEPHLRPADQITNMAWSAADAEAYDATKDPARKRKFDAATVVPNVARPADHLNPPTSNCSGCHR